MASPLSNICPQGTKFWLLEVGWLECDEGYLIRGANSSLKSNENRTFVNKRREIPCYCVLIEHPDDGLVLWETGCGEDYPTVWGPEEADVFARIKYDKKHELPAAVAATGHDIKDIRKVIIGHLHLDHAGGLDKFMGTDVEIWVHEKELKAAFWSAATGADPAVYLSHYLNLSLNWRTFDDHSLDFCRGIVLHHLPGHTEGLIGMQINMLETGTFFFISDHCHVIENWRDETPQGWLARDHPAWFRSTRKLKQLEKLTGGTVVPGHDKDLFIRLQEERSVYI